MKSLYGMVQIPGILPHDCQVTAPHSRKIIWQAIGGDFRCQCNEPRRARINTLFLNGLKLSLPPLPHCLGYNKAFAETNNDLLGNLLLCWRQGFDPRDNICFNLTDAYLTAQNNRQ